MIFPASAYSNNSSSNSGSGKCHLQVSQQSKFLNNSMNNKIEISTHTVSPTARPTAGEVVYIIPAQSSLCVWEVEQRKRNLKFSSWGFGHTSQWQIDEPKLPYVYVVWVGVCPCMHVCVRPQGPHKGEKRNEWPRGQVSPHISCRR